MSDCLLLNADYRPISVYPLSLISWKDAIRLVYLDKVAIVEEYDDWVVRSQHSEMKVPAAVATKFYIDKARRTVAFSRKGVYQRDQYTCQYCGYHGTFDELTLDHVHPSSKGGKTSWDNVVTSCYSCNQKKGDRTDIKPKKVPRQPDFKDILKMVTYTTKASGNHPSWSKILESAV